MLKKSVIILGIALLLMVTVLAQPVLASSEATGHETESSGDVLPVIELVQQGPAKQNVEDEETGDVEFAAQLADSLQIPFTPEINVLLNEMTFVQLLSEEYARIEAACAGIGLSNVVPNPEGSIVLIPNAGDLSLAGSNVSIKLTPDGEFTFIPRTQGQLIRVPMDVGDKVAGQEVLSLSLAEGLELMAANQLVWTAKDFGPYGNGHGMAGHIAVCDPRYSE